MAKNKYENPIDWVIAKKQPKTEAHKKAISEGQRKAWKAAKEAYDKMIAEHQKAAGLIK